MKYTKEIFIEKAKKKHGDKYDYSNVEYKHNREPVCIVCPEHGEFWQKPYTHLNGCGCPECAKKNRKKVKSVRKTTEEFINECIKKYHNKYDYSKAIYVNAHTKVCIINNETKEEVFVSPTVFLRNGCGDKRGWVDTKKWIERAKKAHGNKYDYSITIYEHPKKKIKFICPIHGEIEQLPDNHIKYGCRLCSYERAAKKRAKTNTSFIEEARKIHGGKYDYSKVEYINHKTKVCIICPKHGEFWQAPIKHLCGQGCPKCRSSYLEEKIMVFLDDNNINYIPQYKPIFLKNGRGWQSLDFFLPDFNIGIECQGIQHFIKIKYKAFSDFEKIEKLDAIKAKKCKNNGIKIFYFTTEDNIKLAKNSKLYTSNNIYFDIKKLFNNFMK